MDRMRIRLKHKYYFVLLVSLLLFSYCQKEIVPELYKPSKSRNEAFYVFAGAASTGGNRLYSSPN